MELTKFLEQYETRSAGAGEVIEIDYVPQAKQVELHQSPANEVLFGGAAGPGKSHALRFEALIWALRIPGIQVYLFRRIFPELEKNHILPSITQFPAGIGAYKDQKRRWEFNNSSMLHFCHCQYEMDVFNYQGAEIHILVIDELTTFTEFQYDYLRARCRCTLDIPTKYRHKVPSIICGSNPGGIGHEFAKKRWVEFTDRGRFIKKAPRNEGGMWRHYIPAKLEDNPILKEKDPGYIDRLDALPEPYRTAYKDGDWDIFIGQAFNFNRMDHVIPFDQEPPVPSYAQLYMTMDWGYGAPFSIGWWWVDGEEVCYRFREFYGWNGTPNEGLRWEDSRIAEKIIEIETELKYWDKQGNPVRKIIRLAGPDCWNKKPDYKGGGQGPSTAEVFAGKKIYLNKADPDRKLKIRQFRERLRIVRDPDDNDIILLHPKMRIYETCKDFIRTLPLLQLDPKNKEDIDSSMEDHIYDEACHICMARPIKPDIRKFKRSPTAERIDRLSKGIPTDFQREAEHLNKQVMKDIEHYFEKEYGKGEDFDTEDQDLRNTI